MLLYLYCRCGRRDIINVQVSKQEIVTNNLVLESERWSPRAYCPSNQDERKSEHDFPPFDYLTLTTQPVLLVWKTVLFFGLTRLIMQVV